MSLLSLGAEPLVGRVARWAQERPGDPAYTFVDYSERREGTRRTLSWAETHRKASALAVRLREVTSEGERAAILAPQGLDYVVAVLGCLYAKVIAVPLFAPDLPGHGERLIRAVDDSAPEVVLTTAEARPGVERFLEEHPVKEVLTLDAIDDALAERWTPPAIALDDVAYLQYTSGSTRAPAGVEITHRNYGSNALQLFDAFDADPATSTAVLWLPLFHDMGLIATVAAPLVAGNNAVFMDPVAFIMHPLRWLQVLSEYGDAFTGGPNFAYEYCAGRITEEQKASLDLRGVRVFLNGAEPVRPSTLARFQEAFAGCGLRPESQTPAYGLAEATVFVSNGRWDAPAKITVFDRDELTRGRAVPVGEPAGDGGDERVSRLASAGAATGQHVLIVDPATRLARPDGEVGEIWVHGPNVARAYWNNPERSEETFRARLAGPVAGLPEGPWLRTGDLGVVHEGELYVTGRIKDVIIVDGRNHYPQDVEVTAQEAHEAIRTDHVAAFAVPGEETERLVIVAERSRRAPEDLDPAELAKVVRRAVNARHDLRLHDFVLVPAGTVPRTSSGKIARQACRHRYLDGTLQG
ncbi:fatty acyl-AMP ligase [Bailinhaonella thermotolerans]|uniref:Fatty acyl-AMP ligase n=1 Tax=Bailinhaonella thermotolerans TaxID=1070861 RepID=A0A3A4B0G2_9ACTN|nr:fatty acyl-AMP ligase [Bailinhaonella thermotolerans]RJL30940.1 fatty acyl-AMP ligase [Bailinhaonella thermotolerans]